MNRLLLINYHYVQDPARYRYPGIHPIAPDTLIDQLERLEARMTPASADDVAAFAAGHAGGEDTGFYLTFDDGLKDHIHTARDILQPRGLTSVFFISSRPLVEGRAISVHKVHWLRSQMAPAEFEAAFTARLPEEWRRAIAEDEDAAAAAATIRYDPPEIARLKYAINFLLPYEIVDRVTSEMMAARQEDEGDFCRRFYMNEDEIRALAAAGHKIGCHGHTHRPFSRLSAAELDAELALCTETLSRLAGPIDWLSFPWGSPWALPPDPEALCHRHGFTLAITLERDWNDPPAPRYRLNRINTNEVDAYLQDEPKKKASRR